MLTKLPKSVQFVIHFGEGNSPLYCDVVTKDDMAERLKDVINLDQQKEGLPLIDSVSDSAVLENLNELLRLITQISNLKSLTATLNGHEISINPKRVLYIETRLVK